MFTTRAKLSHATRSRSLRNAARSVAMELLESRQLLSAAFDVVDLDLLRQDPVLGQIDGRNIGVAVLDTGLFANHPDLRGNFVAYFDAVRFGRNAATNPGDTTLAGAIDPEGHGTHVAGTVASTNPEIGVASGADLIGVRVLPSNSEPSPRFDPVIAGLQWVVANHDRYNIKVVNMSLQTPGVNLNYAPAYSSYAPLIDQLEHLGITVVSASGNGYGGFAQVGASAPGIYSTLQVANTWEDAGTPEERDWIGFDDLSSNGTFGVIDDDPMADQLSASSQRSSMPNQVAAPGTTILSTWNGQGGLYYNTLRGTSMASPLVAGMVALMQDAAYTFGGRYLTTDEVVSIVRSTADTIVDSQLPSTQRMRLALGSDGRWYQVGQTQDLPESGLSFQRVNVYRAIQEVRDQVTSGSDPDPQEPPPDPGQRTDDTNNTTAAAIELPSLDGTEDFQSGGNIGYDGEVRVGMNDVDLYKIVLDAPGIVTFELAPYPGGENFDAFLRLFDQTGAQIAYADDTTGLYPTLQSTRLAAGTYYFGISSYDNSAYDIVDGANAADGQSEGDYLLSVSLSNPDPNGVAQGAVAVDLTNPDVFHPATEIPSNLLTGRIGTDPNPLDSAQAISVGATDVDFFQILVPDSGTLTIDIDAIDPYATQAVDSFVRVFDSDMNAIAENDDEFDGHTDSFLEINVIEGETLYVAVTTYGNRAFNPTDPFDRVSQDNETGFYDLYFTFSNGDSNGTAFDAIDFDYWQLDGLIQGTIGADGGVPLLSDADNGGYKDVDFFFYIPAADGYLNIEALSPEQSMQPVLGVWQLNASGDDIVKVADTSGGQAVLAMAVDADEAYYISVTGSGNEGFNWYAPASGTGGDTGDYDLSISFGQALAFAQMLDNSVNLNTPEDIALGDDLLRQIGFDGPAVTGASDIDLFRLTPVADQVLRIRTDTSAEHSADTVLRFFDAAGNELAWNDNISTTSSASELSIAVLAGQTYYIGVSGAGSSVRAYDPLSGSGAGGGSQGSYRLLLGEETRPVLSMEDATMSVEGDAGASNLSITVHLSSPAAEPVSVNYTTLAGTAAAGADYTPVAGTLDFPVGASSASITIPILGDALDEDQESFLLSLSSPAGAGLMQSQATLSIVDDDPLPALSVSNAKIVEGHAGQAEAVFSVSLSSPSGRSVSIHYATAPETATAADFKSTAGILTLAPGLTTAQIRVPVYGDTLYESHETFLLNLSAASNAALAITQARGTIVNDDLARPEIRVFRLASSKLYELQHNLGSVSFGSVYQYRTGPIRAFRITNSGSAKLALRSVKVPSGFKLLSTLPTALLPGKSATFKVQLLSSAYGTRWGTIRIYNSDANENPFVIWASGRVLRARQRAPQSVVEAPLLGRAAVSAHFSDAHRIVLKEGREVLS